MNWAIIYLRPLIEKKKCNFLPPTPKILTQGKPKTILSVLYIAMGLMENKKGSALEKLVSIRWIGVDHTIDKFQVL